uniref:Uncharacterized protein n=1 Tax=Lepeophtheirus salmonis TaxID=72036 RepID=A0A0K2VLG7_LEPSM
MERKSKLTASRFGDICKSCHERGFSALAESILL